MNNETLKWQGGSGKHYAFSIYPIGTEFNPNQDGNYIFAKKTRDGWDAVYIGQGDLQTRTHDNEHLTCAIKKGATHIHAHLNPDEKARKYEEADLLAYNTEAYQTSGCNSKVGG